MRRLLLLPLAAALALTACGGEDPSATTPGTTSGATSGSGSGAAVEIVNFVYTPETIEVTAGTTVTWTNNDSFAHTVTAGTPDAPTDLFDADLGDRTAAGNEGATFGHTFDEPGTYPYFCDLHPSMLGEVVVTG